MQARGSEDNFWRSCLGNRGPGWADTAIERRADRAKRKHTMEKEGDK